MSVRDDCSFGEIRVTAIDWPVVVVEFPEKAVADATLRSALGHLESQMMEARRARERVFTITDISRMRQITPAGQRQLAAEWLKQVSPLARVASVGGATVTPSPVLRGVITALFWLQPSPTPFFCLASRHEAVLRGIELLEAAQVPLSPRLVSYGKNHGVRPAV